MNKVINGSNTNNKKVVGLFVAQVIMGVMPVILLILFVWLQLYNIQIVAIVFILLIFACNIVYMVLGRRYNVLHSGIKGEKRLYRAVKRLGGNNIIFRNLPVRYKKGRSELDLLIISHRGIIIVEVKNHSGTIFGSWKADKWTQKKFYRDGKTTQQEMDNPIKQMRRQRDIVKSILLAAGENVWIDTVLFFSSPSAKLRLSLRENDYVCSSEAELINFLEEYEGGETLSMSYMRNIADILKKAAGQ
ncbi:MAG: NERD domain-containing protein [Oscillospiraceae bacterium]|nr:NERD domain-containing protein [Oscillospiraceae bacterium]